MKNLNLTRVAMAVGLVSALCVSGCAAESPSPDQPVRPAPANLCAGPDASAYMQCPGYRPPENLTNDWKGGGWDAGT
jgi:hypothetical protein